MVTKNAEFAKPIAKNAKGAYKMAGGKTVPTCFTTDFFIAEADEWRGAAWAMMRERADVEFLIITKRIDRFHVALPNDWGDGYANVRIGCTVENQATADYRLPLFLATPIQRKFIACSPLLGPIDLSPYLDGIEHVTVSGESGRTRAPEKKAVQLELDVGDAPRQDFGFVRECDLEWVQSLHAQCAAAGVTFWFKGTGSLLRIGDTLERINPFKQGTRARELGLSNVSARNLF